MWRDNFVRANRSKTIRRRQYDTTVELPFPSSDEGDSHLVWTKVALKNNQAFLMGEHRGGLNFRG